LQVNIQKHSFSSESDRNLLIKIQDRKNLFGELETIFKAFPTQWDINDVGIKSELAENGAYIPSAIYLN
jgi:hypothetical protein